MEQDRISAVEAALRAACTEARAQGLVLVREAYDVQLAGVQVACCAWGAMDIVSARDDREPAPVLPPEYDAIELGLDGERAAAERSGLPMSWYDLGARLAAEFQPVAASTLEAG